MFTGMILSGKAPSNWPGAVHVREWPSPGGFHMNGQRPASGGGGEGVRAVGVRTRRHVNAHSVQRVFDV